MKKYIVFFCFITILFAFCGTCYAAGQIVQISDLDLSLNIPDSYIVITRDTPANGTVANELDEYGIYISEIQNSMLASDMYLTASDISGATEITITSTDLQDETPELKNLDAQQKEDLIDFIIDILAPENINNTTDEYAANHPDALMLENIQAEYIGEETINDILYLVFSIKGEQYGNVMYSKYYFTATRNQGIGVKLFSYDGSISSSQSEILYSVIESMEFSSPESSVVLESQNKTDNFGYKSLIGVIVVGIINLIYWSITLIKRKRKSKLTNTTILSGESTEPKYPEKDVAPDKLYCSRCGKQIPANCKFCRYCGNQNFE